VKTSKPKQTQCSQSCRHRTHRPFLASGLAFCRPYEWRHRRSCEVSLQILMNSFSACRIRRVRGPHRQVFVCGVEVRVSPRALGATGNRSSSPG
jgi:hypothetical protein